MKIKLIKPVIVRNNPGVQSGEVFEPAQDVAGELIGMGAAIPWVEEVIQTREPVIEHRDPIAEMPQQKPSRRRPAK